MSGDERAHVFNVMVVAPPALVTRRVTGWLLPFA
jgi:hypothetical protein